MADWITTGEASKLTGYNTQYIRWLIRNKQLQAALKGNSYWVDRAALLKYARSANTNTDRRHGPKRRRSS
jgi:excisionase family DNA binding protein